MPTMTRDGAAVKVKSPRKPRPQPPRAVNILEPAAPDTDGWMAVLLAVGKAENTYLVRTIEADFGYGFEIEKLDAQLATVETYNVNLMGRESSCTCPGHTFHGHCKHVSALQVLHERGALPRAKYVCCPHCHDRVEAPGLCGTCTEQEAEFAAYHQAEEMEAGGQDPWDCPEADERYEPAGDEPPPF